MGGWIEGYEYTKAVLWITQSSKNVERFRHGYNLGKYSNKNVSIYSVKVLTLRPKKMQIEEKNDDKIII